MDQDKQHVAELAKAEMIRLWEQVDNLNKRIDYQRRLINEHCQHVSVSVRSKYNSGGYDYVSSIQITHTCDLCGKILEAYNDPHHRGTYE
jgi:hypothetical protein